MGIGIRSILHWYVVEKINIIEFNLTRGLHLVCFWQRYAAITPQPTWRSCGNVQLRRRSATVFGYCFGRIHEWRSTVRCSLSEINAISFPN